MKYFSREPTQRGIVQVKPRLLFTHAPAARQTTCHSHMPSIHEHAACHIPHPHAYANLHAQAARMHILICQVDHVKMELEQQWHLLDEGRDDIPQLIAQLEREMRERRDEARLEQATLPLHTVTHRCIDAREVR